LSFSLGDIFQIKTKLIADAREQVEGISEIITWVLSLITFNQVIDVWTSANAQLTELAMKNIREDQQGFNSVYMMLDSGAGFKEQIRQLTGMRGLMAKLKNRLLVVVKLLKTQFFKKVFLSLSTFLLTVRVKVLRIRP
jgi:DNA-directed RNA polymerase subunit beta'